MKQEWRLCPYEWGMEGYITIESSAGKLVLCDITDEGIATPVSIKLMKSL